MPLYKDGSVFDALGQRSGNPEVRNVLWTLFLHTWLSTSCKILASSRHTLFVLQATHSRQCGLIISTVSAQHINYRHYSTLLTPCLAHAPAD
jgi:hypothetical protein